MTLQDLRTILDYHYWGRDRLLDEIEPLSAEQFTREITSSFKSIRDTVAHIHSSEWTWFQRWRGQSPTAMLPADRFQSVADVRRAWTDLERDVRRYFDGLTEAEVNRVFEYTAFTGEKMASELWEMVYHLANHGSYHRGQVTTLLRQVGATPKSTDAIRFFRARRVS